MNNKPTEPTLKHKHKCMYVHLVSICGTNKQMQDEPILAESMNLLVGYSSATPMADCSDLQLPGAWVASKPPFPSSLTNCR